MPRLAALSVLFLGACAAPSTEGPAQQEDELCDDLDGDLVCDIDDNCPADANADQADYNSDGLGDACDTISIAIADLTTEAIWYSFEAQEVTVYYFALLGEDGTPHVAIDACDVCHGAKKGYSQDGEWMVCNNCGQEFHVDDIGDENQSGGCNPGFIPVEITDTHVLIEPEMLEASSWYFE